MRGGRNVITKDEIDNYLALKERIELESGTLIARAQQINKEHGVYPYRRANLSLRDIDKHSDGYVLCFCDYDGENECELPASYLDDPNWEEKYHTALLDRAAKEKAAAEQREQQRISEEKALLLKLKQKYPDVV
jgi:hypothetical protein